MRENRYIFAGIIGGIVFLIIYFLQQVFLISLICGLVSFFVIALILRPSKKSTIEMTSQPTVNQDLKALVNRGSAYIEQLRVYARLIEKPFMVQKIEEIENTSRRIIDNVVKRPKKFDQVKRFLDYYLPVVVRMLERYDMVVTNKLTDENSMDFIKKVEDFMPNIENAFKAQLENIFKDDIFDTAIDIEVLEGMFKSDGLLDNDDFKGR